MPDTETETRPTHPPWHLEPTDGLDDVPEDYQAVVNENDGLVGYIHELDAGLVVALGTAANELPDEYDPVEAQKHFSEIIEALQTNHDSGHTDTCDKVLTGGACTCGWQDAHDALQKARGDA